MESTLILGHEDHKMLMLHLGCGENYFQGWVNLDVDSPVADLKYDARDPLPYGSDSVDFIYSEHFIEHLTVEEGLAVMAEHYRVLKKGGVARIATPDLRYILLKYFFLWKRQEWITRYEYEWIQTRAEMVNIALREWGHHYLYDEEELTRRLKQAGFENISRRKLNRSGYPQLSNRETRKDSTLIVEAVK